MAYRDASDRRLAPVHLGLVAIVVSEYDPAIQFFTDVLGFVFLDIAGNKWDLIGPAS